MTIDYLTFCIALPFNVLGEHREGVILKSNIDCHSNRDGAVFSNGFLDKFLVRTFGICADTYKSPSRSTILNEGSRAPQFAKRSFGECVPKRSLRNERTAHLPASSASAEQLKRFEPTIHLSEKKILDKSVSSLGHGGIPKAVAFLILMTNRSFLDEEFSRTASFLLQEKSFDMLKMLGSMPSAAQDLVFP
jgi:hypothetical protein